MFDPWEVLGVARDADPLTIRRAYQKLARRWHPALHPGSARAERNFREAGRAYALLRDEARGGSSGTGRRPGPEVGIRRRRAQFSGADLVYRFEELAVELLPAEEETPGERQGVATADLSSEVELDFAEAIRGVVVSLSAQREISCEACGEGVPGCPVCGGRGYEVKLERVRVRIPPGVTDGGRVRVRGQGGLVDGGRGDLLVTIRVRPHGYYVRRGDDIVAPLPVTIGEAALGASVRAPTIDGPVDVALPPGTRHGQRLRIGGRGVARPDGGRGDHLAVVEIVPPDPGEGRNRDLLQQLEQSDPRSGLPFERLD